MARSPRNERRARVRRNPLRFLVPIVLAAAIVGTYVIVHANLKDKHKTTTTQTAKHSSTTKSKSKAKPKTYTVVSGDTLTKIADKTGVSVGTLQSLNPSVDPNALQTGQHLRLRR
jgi:LysM repeat protein